MTKHLRWVVIGMLLLALVGCRQHSFGGFGNESIRLDDTVLTRSLQYLDNDEEGPMYTLSFTVPEAWVGEFVTINTGNQISFEYIVQEENEDENLRELRAPIFTVDALSNAQYWEQIGSYPGIYKNILNTADTYFIYQLPIDSFYSGLSDEDFEAFAEQVPGVIASFGAEREGQGALSNGIR